MLSQIQFFIKNIIRIFLERITSPRNSRIYVLGLKQAIDNKYIIKKDVFMHNTKYFYLHLCKNCPEIKAVWLCDDKKMIKKFNERGYKNVYPRKSLIGLWYTIRAGYNFCDQHKKDCINGIIPAGESVNFWHGIPLKKICDDNNIHKITEFLNPLQTKIYYAIRNYYSYLVTNNDFDTEHFISAFNTTSEHVKILGSPRNDALLHDFDNQDLFMEEDYKTIKRLKEQGKKLLFYMPTYRDTGIDISSWLRSAKLWEFLRNNNIILVCKLHFCDINSLNFDLPNEIYKVDSNSDVYSLLKYSDALITDYSSVYFDYLLLDKPIIYYPIDLDEYQAKCHGFYEPYENLTAGIKVYNEQELISSMQDVVNGVDNYKEQREILRNRIFKYQDGKNCERVVEFLKSLDK